MLTPRGKQAILCTMSNFTCILSFILGYLLKTNHNDTHHFLVVNCEKCFIFLSGQTGGCRISMLVAWKHGSFFFSCLMVNGKRFLGMLTSPSGSGEVDGSQKQTMSYLVLMWLVRYLGGIAWLFFDGVIGIWRFRHDFWLTLKKHRKPDHLSEIRKLGI